MSPRNSRFPLALVALVASCGGGAGSLVAPPSNPPPPTPSPLRRPVEVQPTGPVAPVALAPTVWVDLENTYADPLTGALVGTPTGTASVWIDLLLVPGDTVSLTVEFRTSGGARFLPATLVEDTSAVSIPPGPLGFGSPSAPPVPLSFEVTWLLAEDLGPGLFSATSSEPGFGAVEVRIQVAGGTASPLAKDPVEVDLRGFPFESDSSMATPRAEHVAFVSDADTLFVAGGVGSLGPLASAELGTPSGDFPNFDFVAAGSLGFACKGVAQVLDTEGQLWLVGGEGEFGPSPLAERYDPATGTYSPLPSLNFPRAGHALLLLPNGNPIAIGGRTDAVGGAPTSNSYEVFDKSQGRWILGSLAGTYSEPLAVRLSDGRILVTGPAPGLDVAQSEYLVLSGDASMVALPVTLPLTARRGATATVLLSGEVLFVGGHDLAGNPSSPMAELLDPGILAAGTVTQLPRTNDLIPDYLAEGRWDHTATLLGDGRVLLAGGRSLPFGGTLQRLDTYQPGSGQFWPGAQLPEARAAHRTSRLQLGDLVLSGGLDAKESPLGTTVTLTAPDGPDHLPTATVEALSWSPPLGIVTIAYTLFDAESDPARVQIEWTTRPQESGTWRPVAPKTLFGMPFGDGYTELTTSPTGQPHVFVWDSIQDNIFAQGAPNDFYVRVTPIGAEDGLAVEYQQVLP